MTYVDSLQFFSVSILASQLLWDALIVVFGKYPVSLSLEMAWMFRVYDITNCTLSFFCLIEDTMQSFWYILITSLQFPSGAFKAEIKCFVSLRAV